MGAPRPLELRRYRRVVVLTGAGASVASGLRPFRGPGGLLEGKGQLAGVVSAATWGTSPEEVWAFFGPLRPAVLEAEPNLVHQYLAALETKVDEGARVTIITQNIDDLHQRAGSTSVIELHGNVLRSRCTNGQCEVAPFSDDEPHVDTLPRCPLCDAMLRPDVVLFDEPIPGAVEWKAKEAVRECDLFVAVGTSGTVWPAAGFASSALYGGARTILVNLEPHEPHNPDFQYRYYGRAEEILAVLLGE